MALIQFGGLASGLDTKSIITALMDVEQLPLTRLQTAATTITDQKTAYTTLGTGLADLLAKIQAFTVTSAGSARTATSSDATSFTATATTGAIPAQYRVSIDRLANATRATSTGALGTAITDATAAGTMSSLPLPGTVTAGQVGLVIDGRIVNVAVGSPTTTSLKSVIDSVAAAIQTEVQKTDPTAAVTGSIVGNQLRFTVAGASANHDILFGGSADTSNALNLFGVGGQHIANFGGGALGATTITGTSRLGVTRAAGTLDVAGLTGLTSTATGVLTINGVDIKYDSTVDSLNTVLTRINNSQAGVVASVDRTNDAIVLTAKTAGPSPIAIFDTSGTLGAALKLAPGTTNAQVIGQSAQVTVDGRTVTSSTNTVTNAIDGVTLSLMDQSLTTGTLTVGVDGDAIAKSLSDMVSSYNALADSLDALSSNTVGGSNGALHGDATVRGLALSLRSLIMSTGAGLTGSLVSLGDLGVNSGAVGSKAGSTSRLNVDTAKLTSALASDPTRVALLLSSAGGILGPIQDQLKALTQPNGLIDAATSGADAELRSNSDAQAQQQIRIDLRQATLDAKFSALEATMALLQSQSAQLTQQVNAFNTTSTK